IPGLRSVPVMSSAGGDRPSATASILIGLRWARLRPNTPDEHPTMTSAPSADRLGRLKPGDLFEIGGEVGLFIFLHCPSAPGEPSLLQLGPGTAADPNDADRAGPAGL